MYGYSAIPSRSRTTAMVRFRSGAEDARAEDLYQRSGDILTDLDVNVQRAAFEDLPRAP